MNIKVKAQKNDSIFDVFVEIPFDLKRFNDNGFEITLDCFSDNLSASCSYKKAVTANAVQLNF